jgi:hypothetical protein
VPEIRVGIVGTFEVGGPLRLRSFPRLWGILHTKRKAAALV